MRIKLLAPPTTFLPVNDGDVAGFGGETVAVAAASWIADRSRFEFA